MKYVMVKDLRIGDTITTLGGVQTKITSLKGYLSSEGEEAIEIGYKVGDRHVVGGWLSTAEVQVDNGEDK